MQSPRYHLFQTTLLMRPTLTWSSSETMRGSFPTQLSQIRGCRKCSRPFYYALLSVWTQRIMIPDSSNGIVCSHSTSQQSATFWIPTHIFHQLVCSQVPHSQGEENPARHTLLSHLHDPRDAYPYCGQLLRQPTVLTQINEETNSSRHEITLEACIRYP